MQANTPPLASSPVFKPAPMHTCGMHVNNCQHTHTLSHLQVKLGELGEDMRRRLLGLTADDFDDEDLPLGSSTLQPK